MKDEKKTVEEKWKDKLKQMDYTSEEAEFIIVRIQQHPALAFGSPDKRTVELLVEKEIDYLDISEDTKERIIEILNEGLYGNRKGPVSYF
jgi:predicted RNA-binding protein Jag